jgi:hypothetical protein
MIGIWIAGTLILPLGIPSAAGVRGTLECRIGPAACRHISREANHADSERH